MLIFFRADASSSLGTGHIMRCMTLGKALQSEGAEVRFICSKVTGGFLAKIEANGFQVHVIEIFKSEDEEYDLKQDYLETSSILKKFKVDYLIVDHYLLNDEWESYMRPFCSQIVVIDDLANRNHDCDFLIDQNLYENMNERYKEKIPEMCKLLLGPTYAMLRSEFQEERKQLPLRKGQITQILITFGGSDPTQETERCIEALIGLGIKLLVVVGGANPRHQQIKSQCDLYPNIIYHYNIDYMAKLMAESDLAICAGGSSTWERYALGLPGLVVVCASNQLEIAETSHRYGIDSYLGISSMVQNASIRLELERLLKNPEQVRSASQLAMGIVDACGTNRVVQALLRA